MLPLFSSPRSLSQELQGSASPSLKSMTKQSLAEGGCNLPKIKTLVTGGAKLGFNCSESSVSIISTQFLLPRLFSNTTSFIQALSQH